MWSIRILANQLNKFCCPDKKKKTFDFVFVIKEITQMKFQIEKGFPHFIHAGNTCVFVL